MTEQDELAEINEIETERYLREKDKEQRRIEKALQWKKDSQDAVNERAKNRPYEPKPARTTQEPLKRREAVKCTVALKPGRKLSHRSDAGKEDDARYRKVVAEYLEINPDCHHCIELGRENPLPATENHHTAGKVGEMRFKRAFFMAVNPRCHTIWPESIHENTGEAHKRGWLLSRDAPIELILAELLEKRGEWPHVKRELEGI